MFLLHNHGDEELLNPTSLETSETRCLLEGKFTLLAGRSICATVTYANVSQSKSHAYFPLSGPFNLSTKMARFDR